VYDKKLVAAADGGSKRGPQHAVLSIAPLSSSVQTCEPETAASRPPADTSGWPASSVSPGTSQRWPAVHTRAVEVAPQRAVSRLRASSEMTSRADASDAASGHLGSRSHHTVPRGSLGVPQLRQSKNPLV
jgi:hypothetical protein